MGNHVTGCITERILHSKTWRNPLPQSFSQCLLKCFPKCFLISPLAWSPLVPVIWVVCVCWYFSHREGRIREGKEEVTTLVSIFNEFMNFIDNSKSSISNKTGIFFHTPFGVKTHFSGTLALLWRCSGTSDEIRGVLHVRTLGIFLVLGRKFYLK